MCSRRKLLPIIAALFVGMALLWANTERRGGIGVGNNWAMTFSYSQGWPVPYCKYRVQESFDSITGAVANRETFDSKFIPFGSFLDGISALLIIACVVYTCHVPEKSNRRLLQLSLYNLMFLVAFASIVIYSYTNGIAAAVVLAELLEKEPNIFWYLNDQPWYIVLPIAFGITSTLAVFVNLTAITSKQILTRTRTQSNAG